MPLAASLRTIKGLRANTVVGYGVGIKLVSSVGQAMRCPGAPAIPGPHIQLLGRTVELDEIATTRIHF